MTSNTKEYSLNYYHLNKNKNFVCECGHVLSNLAISKHKKSKYHLKYLQRKIDDEKTKEEVKEEIL